ncbi:MAG: DUF4388 domain-containing protein [Gemmatimonadota bacterium]|nr:DUF4388 domain-containing protein [Gemmatimonadota bacterium]
MALRGSLNEVNLADICQLLAMGRKSGCLWITDRSNFGYVYFDQGRVTYASVLNRPDRLGELLVQNGVIDREQLSAAMEGQAHQPGARLGRLLVGQGAMTEEQLKQYVELQISEAVYHLFTWSQGSFHFDPDHVPEEEEARLVSINAENLLLEGARRVDEWSLIEKRIPSFDLVFSLTRQPEGDEIELTGEQRKVIAALDGQRSVDEVVRETGLVEFAAGKALYGLVQAGFAEQSGRKVGAQKDTPEARIQRHLDLGLAFDRAGLLEDAAREFRRVVELDEHNELAHRKLARIALHGKKAADALHHYGALPGAQQKTYGVLRNRALALEMLGRYDEALQLLDVAEGIRPSDVDLFLHRGIALLKADQPRGANDAFIRYRERLGKRLPPPIYFAHAVLAAALDGSTEDAVRIGREGLASYPKDGAILVNTGAVLEQVGEPAASEAFYLRAVGQDPPPQAHKNLGDLAHRRGDLGGARAHYERAVRVEPQLGDDVYARLGQLARQDADLRRAGEYFQRALELNPSNEAARSGQRELEQAHTG